MMTVNQPISEIIKNKDSEEGPKKKTREEWRKEKELEEARKLGTVPAEVDESGKDINPHIPQYIVSAPWYVGARGPTLKHQRIQEDKVKGATPIDLYYNRDVRGPTATKFRDGACTNCGAMGHKKKDCFERPRKMAAQYTSSNIAPDERELPKLELDFDGKRDRWNGYDPSDYQQVVDRYAKIEQTKRMLKEQKLVAEPGQDSDEDEEKYADDADMPGTKVDSKQRITVRNLRIREDPAKYLLNLDPNSAYYDPKSRSMRDDPFSNTKRPADINFGGDSFVRYTGDTKKHVNAQIFAWQAYEKGMSIHLQAEPTKAEVLHKEYAAIHKDHNETTKGSILERYGGKEHLESSLSKDLLLSQSEHYVEYNRQGVVKEGKEREAVKSSYEEDVLVNNHTTIWGSFWRQGHWGYRCCHSFVYNSYCTGEAGKASKEPTGLASIEAAEDSSSQSDHQAKTLVQLHQENLKKKTKKTKKKSKSSHRKDNRKDDSSSSSDEESSKKKAAKLQKALEKEDQLQAAIIPDDRKRAYNSMAETKAPTEEEIEAYYRKRKREEDPMNNFL